MRASIHVTLLAAALAAGQFGLAQAQTDSATGARPGNDIGTRESLPLSPYASNITAVDTRSTIAPTPPLPAVGPGATAGELLLASRQALAAGQTGTAQEALERAETRLLDRTVPQTQTNYTSEDPTVTAIDQALAALGNGNRSGAMQMIDQLLASNNPELSE